MKKIKQGDKVELQWIDTYSKTGWFNEKEINKDALEKEVLNFTIGYFVSQSGSYINLAMSDCPIDGFNRWGLIKAIPTKCIKKIIKLTPSKLK